MKKRGDYQSEVLRLLSNYLTISQISKTLNKGSKAIYKAFAHYVKKGWINKDRTLTSIGVQKVENKAINYESYLERLEKGESLNSFKNENKDIRWLRSKLIKLYPKRYKEAVYGKIINLNKGYELYKLPKKQTDRTETFLTKRAKEYINKNLCDSKAEYEIGIWLENFKKKYVVDVWYNNIGYEICFSQITSKKIIKKVKNYLKFCDKVIVILPKNKNIKSQNKDYPLLKNKLKEEGIEAINIDLTPTGIETGIFPMELEK